MRRPRPTRGCCDTERVGVKIDRKTSSGFDVFWGEMSGTACNHLYSDTKQKSCYGMRTFTFWICER